MSFLRQILERSENERPYVLIQVGFPVGGFVVPDLEREPLDETLVRC